MKELIKFGLILGIICLVATLVLAVTYEVTKPKIEAQSKRGENAALKEIMPDAASFNEKEIGGIKYFEALKGKTIIGYCVTVVGEGYGGYMHLIVGIDQVGVIKGVRVLDHQETPGLGSQISEVKPGEKDPGFLRQFIGKSARTVEVGKNIDTITGATISSKAVTSAVNKTVNEFLAKMKR